MPWRTDTRPYYVLVSEIMLQQTQVERVIPKFEQFIAELPNVEALASAPLSTVLRLWSGLGYNRRAKYLWEAAKAVCDRFAGILPQTAEELMSLPGVGPNTAGAILAYSFNKPAVFVETNIRTVFFYHFFDSHVSVSDKQLKEAVADVIDAEHPREWYWALMDYGSFLKKEGAGALTKSAHYKKQAPLKGSLREVRGAIVKRLASGDCPEGALRQELRADERFAPALAGLLKEGIIEQQNGVLRLAG